MRVVPSLVVLCVFIVHCDERGLVRLAPSIRVCVPPLSESGDDCFVTAAETVSFGETIEGFQKQRAVVVHSLGRGTLTVERVTWLENPEGAFTLATPAPMQGKMELKSGDAIPLPIEFKPPRAGAYSGKLLIESNDPEAPSLQLSVQGKAVKDCQRVEEQFHQPAAVADRVDVLFVIDDSGSMEATQRAVKEQIERFIAGFITEQIDYRLAVTTTDLTGDRRVPGALVSASDGTKVVSPGPDAAEAFGRIMDRIDTEGSGIEYGFRAAKLALSDALDPTFIRNDARLAIVFVSDEEDGGTPSVDPNPAESYIDYFKSLKPEGALRIVAIVDPSSGPQQGCSRTAATSGTPRYHRGIAAAGSAGKIIDYCSEFAAALADAGSFIAAPRCRFALSHAGFTPDEEVELAGSSGTYQWSYTPPTASYPNGYIDVLGCPQEAADFRVTYAACIRAQDHDGDAVPDYVDNCVETPNPTQADTDMNTLGDACQ